MMKTKKPPLSLALSLSLAIVACLSAATVCEAQSETNSKVSQTKHNLSGSGPGSIKIAGQRRVCTVCHTPHASSPVGPLWNRADPGTYYQTYKSTTLLSQVGQPTGSSRLCLSCHDGTIAITQTYNSKKMTSGAIYITRRDKGFIGTDLSDDHPISFPYNASLAARTGRLQTPSALPRQLKLSDGGKLQCATCHDPHNNQFGHFLTMSNNESRMCRTCHLTDGWAGSSHAKSGAFLAGARRATWDNIKAKTVRQAACGSCHRPHSAGGPQRLMRWEAEEDNCLACHDGTVAATNIVKDLAKISTHPVGRTTGVHDPLENTGSMRAHVECSDCHNPHSARGGKTTRAPLIKPAMTGATGQRGGAIASGKPIPATYEYEVCYKCHAGSNTVRAPLVDRVIVNTDCASEFATGNASFHPVETTGKNRNVPSLAPRLKVTSRIHCTDCHGSDSATGAKGLHGSRFRPLLRRQYTVRDPSAESPRAYALCYSCHERSSILADRSFSQHEGHIVDQKTSCAICHDPHGVNVARSTGVAGTHLINFERRTVRPSKTTQTGAIFEDKGRLKGSCTLYCHGEDHVDRNYPN